MCPFGQKTLFSRQSERMHKTFSGEKTLERLESTSLRLGCSEVAKPPFNNEGENGFTQRSGVTHIGITPTVPFRPRRDRMTAGNTHYCQYGGITQTEQM